MKRLTLLLATVCVVAPMSTANAADVDIPAYDWSGAYIGVQAGYLWGDAETDVFRANGTVLRHGEQDVDSWLAGLYAGYNHQTQSNFVLGVDADFAFMDANSGLQDTVTETGAPGGANFHGTDVDWTGALRLRVGYAADRFMPYIAGGAALAEANFNFDHANDDGTLNDTLLGWTIGAGLEWAATDNLIVRTEYRYADYGSTSGNVFALFPAESQKGQFKSHDVRLGLAWKF